jgi:hypothetical protein
MRDESGFIRMRKEAAQHKSGGQLLLPSLSRNSTISFPQHCSTHRSVIMLFDVLT